LAGATLRGRGVRPQRSLERSFQEQTPRVGEYRHPTIAGPCHRHPFLYQRPCLQTFKYIFTSPSSVEKEAKATRSGNARLHGMTRVTRASIAYTATQVRWFPASINTNTDIRFVRASFGSPCHHLRCSAGPTRQRTLNDSTRVYWNSWMTPRRRARLTLYYNGGTGMS
jgi:hypothetical protein